jgi:chemotaxis-related protein WspB
MFVLSFRAAQSSYAVDVTRVVEVVPRIELRKLPHAPLYLAGLFDYRGTVTPVLDLGLLLGSLACPDRLSTRIIVTDSTAAGYGSREPRSGLGQTVIREEAKAGGHPVQPSRNRRWIVGLIAEVVGEVVSIKPGQVISPPIQLPQAPYLGAIVTIDGTMVQLIAPDKVLSASLRQMFFGIDPDEGPNGDPPAPSKVGSM